jgi:quercetin 2,3-dioxygenase
MHPHQEMEVITYCTQGVFEHADDLRNGGLLYPGDVQHTTIGSGMMHSEINHPKTEPMTFIQVWIFPWKQGLTPRVQQKHVIKEERLNRFFPLISNRAPGALPIEQDAEAFAAATEPGVQIMKNLGREQGAYLYLISGAIRLNGNALEQGDAAEVIEEQIAIETTEPSELFMVIESL